MCWECEILFFWIIFVASHSFSVTRVGHRSLVAGIANLLVGPLSALPANPYFAIPAFLFPNMLTC